MLSVRRDGVEPPQPAGEWVTATEAHLCPADACCFDLSNTGGSRTHRQSRRFELRRFSVCVPCLIQTVVEASPMGFEPMVSTLTGWRALRTAPRGRGFVVAQVGLEPTASLRPTFGRCPNQSGLPIAYRAGLCAQSEIRTHKHSGLNRVALPVGVSGPSGPGWS